MKTVSIDKFGRIVIPKDLHKELYLHSGQRLEIPIEDDELIIKNK